MARRSKTDFSEQVAACGLSQAEVAELTGRSISWVQKAFLSGIAPVEVTDALGVLYSEIEAKGHPRDVTKLPEGARRRRQAILQLRLSAEQVKVDARLAEMRDQ